MTLKVTLYMGYIGQEQPSTTIQNAKFNGFGIVTSYTLTYIAIKGFYLI